MTTSNGTTKSPPQAGRELQRAARSIAYRSRSGLYPVAAGGGLWSTAAALHGASPLVVLGGAAALAVAGVAVEPVRTWIGRARWRIWWAGGALAAATVWTSAAVQVGAGMDTPMPTIGIIGGGLLAVPWWWIHRIVPARKVPPVRRPAREVKPAEQVKAIEPPATDEPHPDQAAWRGHVAASSRPLAGSDLVAREQIYDHAGAENGSAWTIDGGPKRHTYRAMVSALEDIKASLDRPEVDSLIHLERDPGGWKTRARLVVLERNPLIQGIQWDGPRLNPATGQVPMAVYPDGSGWAQYMLYRPGWGTPHDLLAGVTGGGKSGALRLIVGESIFAGAAVFLFDPHCGASFGDGKDRVTRSFYTEREIYAGMRGVAAAQEERLRILAEVGEDRMGPEHGYPIIHAVIDEASSQAVLGNTDVNRIILSGVQEGRKLWMKWTLAMQRPSVDAFDGNSDAREQLLSGNVIVYRVATAQTARMANAAGLDIEPHRIPASFDRAGTIPTAGLGYVLGATRRELLSRTINFSKEAFARHVPNAAQLDDRTREAFERGHAEALADMAIAGGGEPADERPRRSANVTPIGAPATTREKILTLFREHGRLRMADIAAAGICSLPQAYRVVASLDQVAETGEQGVYELRTG